MNGQGILKSTNFQIMNIFSKRLSFKIGSLIIITEVLALLALGIFYSARFTGDINSRFEYQVKTPGLLMSKGLLKYETARDKSTMEGIVGDSILNCMVIGANQKIYYSVIPGFEGKQLNDIPEIHKFTEFNKEIKETVIEHASKDGKDYLIVLSPIRFQNGKFLGYLYSEINAINLNHSKNNLIIIFILGTFLCIVISSIVIIYLFNRFITVKIKLILTSLELLKEGDLNASKNVEVSEDELGRIAQSIIDLEERLRNIIENINNGAVNLSQASIDLNANSMDLADGTTQLASIAEEVASSMEEMSVNTHQNAENAYETEKISEGAAREVSSVGIQASESLSNVKEIAGKITIINDIAFQTNLLALNAAVEAARAGDYGKGFSVVAAEVKKLAERCKIAADDINQLSRKSVNITEHSVKSINLLVPEIEKTAKLVKEISASSKEQNLGSDQINNAIQQLNQITQANSTSSEHLAKSSQSLSEQAESLRDLIAFFKM